MLRRKPIDKMLWISLGIIVVMGGMTLAFRDPTFIKWKPAGALLGLRCDAADLRTRLQAQTSMRSMTQGQIEMPDRSWVLLGTWFGSASSSSWAS